MADGGSSPGTPRDWDVRQDFDLVVTVLLALTTAVAVLTPGVAETPLRIVLGVPFLTFVPGYALVSALFPRAKEAETEGSDLTYVGGGIGGFERVALSVGSSVAVVSLVGYFLDFTSWNIRLVPVTVAVCGFTTVMAVVASFRRARTPAPVRFSVPVRNWSERFRTDDRTEKALNAILAVSLILALGSVAYAATSPDRDSSTQFYALTNNESGTPVAAGYPRNISDGAGATFYLGIENDEGRDVNYTVVALVQRVDNETNRVRQTERLGRTRVSVRSNRAKRVRQSVSPTASGDRLTFLLYRGEPPANPTRENAYRVLHFPLER